MNAPVGVYGVSGVGFYETHDIVMSLAHKSQLNPPEKDVSMMDSVSG